MIRILFFAVFASTIFLNAAKAQKLTATQVQNIVNSKHYSFEALTVNPQSGATKQLTTEYFLKISGDTLISYLPYFGRAYNAPVNPADAGYDFTSTKFDYKVAPKKKDSYQIEIKTKENVYNPNFVLTIYNNGNANLQVSSSDRQPISFTGYVKQNSLN